MDKSSEFKFSQNTHLIFVITALIIGMGLRLFLAYNYYGNFDQTSYEIVARIMMKGGNVFAETYRYNYSPAWSYILYSLKYISKLLDADFHFILRSFLSAIDLLNAVVIGYLGVRLRKSPFVTGFAIYLLNPVSILMTGYHGQFENLAILPILIASYLYIANPTLPNKVKIAIFILGSASFIIKHITIFLVWMLFYYTWRFRRAIIALLFSLILFFVMFLPYLPEGQTRIINRVILYEGAFPWGLMVVLGNGIDAEKGKILAHIIFFVFMVISPFIAKKFLSLPFFKSLEFSSTALLSLIYGVGEQFFVLPIYFGSANPTRWFWVYTIITSIFLLGSENNLNLPQIPSMWGSVWIIVLGWFLSFLYIQHTGAGKNINLPQGEG